MARATLLGLELTSSHWGAYEVQRTGTTARGLGPFRDDRAPSPIGLSMFEAYRSPLRVQRPAVRKGWLDRPAGDPRRGVRMDQEEGQILADLAILEFYLHRSITLRLANYRGANADQQRALEQGLYTLRDWILTTIQLVKW
jgi:hypothetical protein